jgi:glycosyltransferase involved in cell wall biosynthesis
MKLSFVICTRDRHDQLGAALDALARIRTDRPWEIVLVDNGSTDATRETIERFLQANSNLEARYIYEAQPGLGAARDTGWRACTGDVVTFTDDDCYPSPDYVDELLRVFEEPAVGFVGGRIELFDPEDARVTIDLRDEPEVMEGRRFVSAGSFHGANLSFRREVLERIGGVDRGLGAGTPFPCEDIDMVAAALWAGYRGAYAPQPIVYHHHRRREADLPAVLEGYDRGRGAYYMKYILRPDTRRAYIAGWLGNTRPFTHRANLARLSRELRAATSYLRARGSTGAKLVFLPALGLASALAHGAASIAGWGRRLVRP